jgi:hypothetical protein
MNYRVLRTKTSTDLTLEIDTITARQDGQEGLWSRRYVMQSTLFVLKVRTAETVRGSANAD